MNIFCILSSSKYFTSVCRRISYGLTSVDFCCSFVLFFLDIISFVYFLQNSKTICAFGFFSCFLFCLFFLVELHLSSFLAKLNLFVATTMHLPSYIFVLSVSISVSASVTVCVSYYSLYTSSAIDFFIVHLICLFSLLLSVHALLNLLFVSFFLFK